MANWFCHILLYLTSLEHACQEDKQESGNNDVEKLSELQSDLVNCITDP